MSGCQETLLTAEEGYIVRSIRARMTGLPIEYMDIGHVVAPSLRWDQQAPTGHAIGGPESAVELGRAVATSQGNEETQLAIAYHLADLVCNPAVAQGILTCNWQALDRLSKWASRIKEKTRLNADDRANLLTVALYLQRLCAKNDSNGAYGPIFWGSLDPRLSEIINIAHDGDLFGIGKSVVSVAYWAADLILRKVVLPRLPTAQRVPRRHPLTVIDGERVTRIEILQSPPVIVGPVVMDEHSCYLLSLYDGEATLGDIAHISGLDLDRVVAIAEHLAETGWIILGPEIPVGTADPLAWLREWVERHLSSLQAEPVHQAIATLEHYRRAYAEPAVEVRKTVLADATAFVSQATGIATVREVGTFYTDRYVLVDHAARDWQDLRLGAPVLRIIDRDLLPLLRAMLVVPTTRWRGRHKVLSNWVATRFDGRAVSLPEFCQAAAQEAALIERLFHRVEQETDRVAHELLGILCPSSAPRGAGISVDRHRLFDFIHRYPKEPCAVQPDIMLVTTAMGPHIVLGDLHATHDLLINGASVRLHPEPDRLVKEVWAGCEAVFAERVCVPVMEHTDQTVTSLSLPTWDVEVKGRSRKKGALRLAAADLSVRCEDDRLRLIAPNIGPVLFTRIPVWHPTNRDAVLSLFAPPYISRFEDEVWPRELTARQLPRIWFGDVVAMRRTWIVEADEFSPHRGPDPFSHQIEAWRRQVGAPVRLFVRLPFEHKPVLVDFANPFLTEWLRRRIVNKKVSVQFVEMYPDIDDLWLRDRRGRYCIEFRLSVFLRGA
jgi:hypothetical protein